MHEFLCESATPLSVGEVAMGYCQRVGAKAFNPQDKSSTNLLDPETLRILLVAVRLSAAA